MKDNKLSILVTAAGNVFMPGTLENLRNNGERPLHLVGADMNRDDTILLMCDSVYQVPKCTDPFYIESLLEICRKEKVDILLPIMSAELNALSQNRNRFLQEGTIVSVSGFEAVSIANDKTKLFDFMQAHNLPCAHYYKVHNAEELKTYAEVLGYPDNNVCIKVSNGSGSRGFRILSEKVSRFHLFMNEKPSAGLITLKEMLDILGESQNFPELMLMEYLPGEEYSVDLLADHGTVLVSCCRKSLRMENSIMLETIIVDHPHIIDLCKQVTEGLKLDGNIGFDLKERYDGTPVIMECNPRITAGVTYFAKSGVNLPYLCIKKLLGETLPEVSPMYGTVIRRRWQEMVG